MIEEFKNELRNIAQNILSSNSEKQEIYSRFFKLKKDEEYLEIDFLKETAESLLKITNQETQKLKILIPRNPQNPYFFATKEGFGVNFEKLFENNPEFFPQLLDFLDEINIESTIEISVIEEKSKNSSRKRFEFLDSLTKDIFSNSESQNQEKINGNIELFFLLEKKDSKLVINEVIAQLLESQEAKKGLQFFLKALQQNQPEPHSKKDKQNLEIYQNSVNYLQNLIAQYDEFDRFFIEIDDFFQTKDKQFQEFYENNDIQQIKDLINDFINHSFSVNSNLIKGFCKKSLDRFLKRESQDEELQEILLTTKNVFIEYIEEIIDEESEIQNDFSSILKEIMINNHFALLQDEAQEPFLYSENPNIDEKSNLLEQVSTLESQSGLKRRELPKPPTRKIEEQRPQSSVSETQDAKRMLPSNPRQNLV